MQISRRSRRAVAGALWFGAASVLPASSPVRAQASVSEAMFSQLSWLDEVGSVLFPNSSWGTLALTLHPDPHNFYYVNVVASAGATPAWVVQNFPIFPVDLLAEPRQAVDFSIRELGVAPGTPLSALDAFISVDAFPRTVAPIGGLLGFGVTAAQSSLCGCGCEGPPPADIGEPVGHKAAGAVVAAQKEHAIPAVQQTEKAGGTCMAAAFARSLSWLNTEYKLGSKLTAQQIHDDLVTNGGGTADTRTEILAGKVKWAGKEYKGRIATKLLDPQDLFGPIGGVTEAPAGTDLVEWITKELRTEDVELAYKGHIVTLASIYTQDGKTYVKYRTDEHPDDDTKGDGALRTGQLVKVGTKYFFQPDKSFGLGDREVRYAVSESVVPEPSTVLLVGAGLLVLGATVRRRRTGALGGWS